MATSLADLYIKNLNLDFDSVYDIMLELREKYYPGQKGLGENIFDMVVWLSKNEPEIYSRFILDLDLEINLDAENPEFIYEILLKTTLRYFMARHDNDLIYGVLCVFFGETVVWNIFKKYGEPKSLKHYVYLANDLNNDSKTEYYNILIGLIDAL